MINVYHVGFLLIIGDRDECGRWRERSEGIGVKKIYSIVYRSKSKA